MLIINANIMTMDGLDYENGYIKVENGKITGVGDMKNVPHDEKIYDAKGGYVVPGLIDAHCHIGLFGDGVGIEGEDCNESAEPITPHLRALDGVNMLDGYFEEARKSGVTTVAVSPGSANVMGGQILALKTFGTSVDDAVIKEPLALKIAFGENPKAVHTEKDRSPVTRMATAAMLRQALYSAQHYRDKVNNLEDEAPEIDLKNEMLLKVLEKEIPIHAHAHRADDIFTAMRIGKEFGIEIKIVHGTEGHLIAEHLAKDGIQVMAGPLLCDRSKPELANLSYKNVQTMCEAGVKVCIITDHPEIPINYLLLTAQLAAKNGMNKNEALRSITVNAAEILGLGDKIGRISENFDADMVIYTKHPMDFDASVKDVFISGNIV